MAIPSSPSNLASGATISEAWVDAVTTDFDYLLGMLTGTSYSAKVYQQAAPYVDSTNDYISTSTNSCLYFEFGTLCICYGYVLFTGAGNTAGADIAMRTPRGFASSFAYAFGVYNFTDSNTGLIYSGNLMGQSVTHDSLTFDLPVSGVASSADNLGDSLSIATGDVLRFGCVFQSDQSSPVVS